MKITKHISEITFKIELNEDEANYLSELLVGTSLTTNLIKEDSAFIKWKKDLLEALRKEIRNEK